MSINGISNPLLPNVNPLHRPDATRPHTDRAGTTGTQASPAHAANTAPALKPQMPIAGHSATQSTVPPEAPAGTDPALWSVLTSEERNFFAKTAALGPLTYSRIKSVSHPAPPTARGVRLDVRA